jgi:hypothetical protein
MGVRDRASQMKESADRGKVMPAAEDFPHELFGMMDEAHRARRDFVEINAGELHKKVGDYTGRNHQMPNCCQVRKAKLRLIMAIRLLMNRQVGKVHH